MPDAAFKQHQYAFTAHIRDPEGQPVPDGIEARRMAIYTDLLYNNIEGFIRSGFPVIREIYSDENWHRMVRDFFARHRSKTPYFLEIAQEFIDYLKNERAPQPEDPPGLVELAHYEWVEMALHVSNLSIDMADIDANGDLMSGPPVISPLAWPLVYDYPVHEMGPDCLPDPIDPANPVPPTCLVVYRNRNDEVKFLHINPVTARLIHLIENNPQQNGRQLIETIIDELKHPQPEVVMQGGVAALQELQQHGIILGTRIAGAER